MYFVLQITEEKQLKIQKYKQQALEVEKRLKDSRNQKPKTSNVSTNNNSTLVQNCAPISNASLNKWLNVAETPEIRIAHADPPNVPCEYTKPLKPLPNLTFNIVDISEYNESGYCSYIPNMEERFASPKDTIKIAESPIEALPRLVRSNSYVLESPSPIVLELLKEQQKSSCDEVKDKSFTVEKHDCDLCDDNSKQAINESADDSFLSASCDLDDGPSFPSSRQLEGCIQDILNLIEQPNDGEADIESKNDEFLIDFTKDVGNACDNFAGDIATSCASSMDIDDSWLYSPSSASTIAPISNVATPTAVLVDLEEEDDCAPNGSLGKNEHCSVKSAKKPALSSARMSQDPAQRRVS